MLGKCYQSLTVLKLITCFCLQRYIDETGAKKCKNDGTAPFWWQYRYVSQSSCCTSHFNWAYHDCMGTKPASSNKWYIDWSSSKCKQDCEKGAGMSCGGLMPGAWVLLHNSSDACCRAHVLYAVESCVIKKQHFSRGRIHPTTPTTTHEEAGANI